MTSAGTIIMGLLLMGTTKFKLFSSTGPSVAMGLAVALAGHADADPALLILLARIHPRSFDGLAGGSREFWDRLGRAAMARPLRSWAFTVLAMVPLSILGLRTQFIQDLMTELPREHAVGAGLWAGRLEVRPGDAGSADGGARVGHRLPHGRKAWP